VMKALYDRPNYANEDWLVLLTTDHGGIAKGHGGNTDDERRIWWIGTGTNIVKQQIFAQDPGSYRKSPFTVDSNLLKLSPVQADIAVTALHHLIFDSGIHPKDQPQWNLDGKSWLERFTTGIEEPSNLPLVKIYPNPNRGLFTIWFENPSDEIVEYQLVDIGGKTVESGKTNSAHKLTVDISNRAKGTYFAMVKTSKHTISQKILIQ